MENGSRRVQTLFIHSPRLPNWNRGEAAIRKQLEISWLLWSGRTHRQSPLGNGPDTLTAERISPGAQGLFASRIKGAGLRIRPPSNPGKSPKIEYVLKKNVPYVPTPLPFEDMLFLISDGGIASCLKTATGEVLWRERLDGNYFASPILANGKVWIVSREGEVRVLSISSEKWRSSGYRSK